MTNFLYQYQTVLGKISFAFFLLLCFLLPFPWHFVQPIAVIWLILWALEGRWVRAKNFSFTQNQIPLLLLVGFLLWEILSLLWTNNSETGMQEIKKHLPILGILLVGLFGTNKTYDQIQVKKALYIGSIASIIAYTTVVYWCKTNEVVPVFVNYYKYDIWSILGNGPIGLIKHRLYYCLILTLALCFSGDLYQHYKSQKGLILGLITFIVGDLFLIIAIILTGSRTMMMLLPIIAIIALVRNSKGWIKWSMLGLLIIGVTACGAWMMEHNSRFLKTQEEVFNISAEQLQTRPFETEPRIYIWHTIFSHYNAYSLKGMGIGSANDFMMECYQEEGIPEVIEKAYGPHSTYFYTWMELGPFAVIYLLLILCLSPLCHQGVARKDAVWSCLILGWGMLTETIHTRMIGIYILLTLLVLIQIEARESDSSQPAHP